MWRLSEQKLKRIQIEIVKLTLTLVHRVHRVLSTNVLNIHHDDRQQKEEESFFAKFLFPQDTFHDQ